MEVVWPLVYHGFIHSGYFYISTAPLHAHYPLRGAPDYSIDTVSELYAEALQATGG